MALEVRQVKARKAWRRLASGAACCIMSSVSERHHALYIRYLSLHQRLSLLATPLDQPLRPFSICSYVGWRLAKLAPWVSCPASSDKRASNYAPALMGVRRFRILAYTYWRWPFGKPTGWQNGNDRSSFKTFCTTTTPSKAQRTTWKVRCSLRGQPPVPRTPPYFPENHRQLKAVSNHIHGNLSR